MRRILMMLAMLGAFGFSAGLVGCEQEGPVEEMGEGIDEAVEDTGEGIEDAADDIEDGVD